MNVKTGGVIALTLAAMLFLSGVWSMTLSPATTYSQTKYDLYQPVSINGLETSSYSVDARQGDTLIVRVNGIRDGNSQISSLKIYDPDNGVVWSEVNTTYAHFHSKTVKSGLYRIEVLNPSLEAIECYVQIRLSAEVTYRPLEPVGSWLILMSLPVFGLGVWASGLYKELKPYIFPPRPRGASSSTLA